MDYVRWYISGERSQNRLPFPQSPPPTGLTPSADIADAETAVALAPVSTSPQPVTGCGLGLPNSASFLASGDGTSTWIATRGPVTYS